MSSPNTRLEVSAFFVILTLLSLAFIYIMLPFWGAILWAFILALLFSPMQRGLEKRFNGKRNLAACLTMSTCMLIVVIPVIFVINSLFQEGKALLPNLDTDLNAYLQSIMNAISKTAQKIADKVGWEGDLAPILANVKTKLLEFAGTASRFIGNQAYSLGQMTFQFIISLGIMLYLLFFLLRDGAWMSHCIFRAIPMADGPKTDLFEKFATVIRATVKGNIIIALIQGALGGAAFWFYGVQGAVLWGCIMAVLSLLPAVGASLVWGPVALYFFAVGMIWQGVTLIIFGVVVIGTIDYALRPILVGKDTKLPDWLIMLSTLGGIALIGINGFVLGPLVAAMFIAIWAVLTERREHAQSLENKPNEYKEEN